MFPLPWTRCTVPHAVIELTRECNLSCRACYRQKTPGMRPITDILADVTVIERHQRVHTISLAGGEPTLHPELVSIIQAIKARGHRVALVTNALLLTDQLLSHLKQARLDIVMIHVDEGQHRPDLADAADINQVNQLREIIAERVHSHQIAVGLCTTLYPESIINLPDLIRLFLRIPHINFLFATHSIAISDLVDQTKQADGSSQQLAGTTNRMVMSEMRRHFGLDPYAYLAASHRTDDELPCITYSVPVSHGASSQYLRMNSGTADRILVKISRLLAGRYLYFTPERLWTLWIQILFNGLFSGHLYRNSKFLGKSSRSSLRIKRLVFENAPRINPNGTINCCEFCPNSTVRNGQVVPVCIADHYAKLN